MTLFKKVFQQQGKPVELSPEEREASSAFEDLVQTAFDDDRLEEADADHDPDPDVLVLGATEAMPIEPESPGPVEEDDAWDEPDLAYVMEQARIEDEDRIEEIAAHIDPVAEVEVGPGQSLEDLKQPQPETGAEPDAHLLEEKHTTEPAPSDAEDILDVAAFAREQMRAANPPDTEAPALDLSQHDTSEGEAAAALQGRAGRRAGRVKTRLLGFNRGAPDASDPFDTTQVETAIQGRGKFPVGWLVVVDGPGTGHSFALFSGASMIGRGEEQVIKLDFGDNSISRQNHAAIAYDDEENKFYIGHGGKSNIIRLNARPVLSTEELHHTDLIRIGETTLRFVALCGKDFQWDRTGGTDATSV